MRLDEGPEQRHLLLQLHHHIGLQQCQPRESLAEHDVQHCFLRRCTAHMTHQQASCPRGSRTDTQVTQHFVMIQLHPGKLATGYRLSCSANNNYKLADVNSFERGMMLQADVHASKMHGQMLAGRHTPAEAWWVLVLQHRHAQRCTPDPSDSIWPAPSPAQMESTCQLRGMLIAGSAPAVSHSQGGSQRAIAQKVAGLRRKGFHKTLRPCRKRAHRFCLRG